ncbi:metallophosphoesterase [Tundrisphaera sp. TA3]|uniref:metallophosphoesterase n=1 Tax=Tundrisphaera sp. TA3 TaxID=3435775 RepID=UPI003EBF262B
MHASRAGLAALALLTCLIPTASGATPPADERARSTALGPRYLQLGDQPAPDGMTVVWHAEDADAPWSVESRSPVDAAWKPAAAAVHRRILLEGEKPFRVYRATLGGLTPGATFDYRIKYGNAVDFEGRARAKPAPGAPQRLAVFGDCAAGSAAQKQVAYQIHRAKPEYAVITGDIVYSRGRLSEYREKFYPIYGHRTASPASGAPLLDSTLFIAVPGNHDVVRNFDANTDLMAYFYLWSQPLNGPIGEVGAASTPVGVGNAARIRTLVDAAGPNYPRMANFSFDIGDVHWTMLDANPYVDWNDPTLRGWLERDLAAAAGKPWRFVAFHHPGFNSSKAHAGDQQMRRVADLLERGGVSIAFAGHVHNYQRSYPLKFAAREEAPEARPKRVVTRVDGDWTLDQAFDGSTQTRPNGVIYLITGAAGAPLYDPDQTTRPASWRPFTQKFVADVHSFTVVDVSPNSATIRQIDVDGVEVDHFTISR